MCPILLRIGPLKIPGYGFMLAMGFLLSMYLAQRDAKKYNIIDEQKLANLFPFLIIAAAVGARLFHAIVERPAYFWDHPIDFFKVWDGGVTFYGGFIAALLAGYYYCRKHNLNMLKLYDFLIAYVPLGQTFGRLGCFLAGCCHGIPTSLPWGITITNPESVTRPLGVPLHPTQLYQALWNFMTFIIVYRGSRNRRFTGQNLLLFGMIFPVGRTIIEFFRGDEVRGYIINGVMTTSQGISLLIFVPCLTIYIYKMATIKKKSHTG
jgi:phosphatidylglycerol---prolipoprotein diacylglyceryl transferase